MCLFMSDFRPVISIVIPAYNATATLSYCLEGVFASDYDNFEVIVVDDCSSDSTGLTAEEYGASVLKVSRPSGAAFARNRGVDEASGDIILFIDSDIVIEPNTLSLVAGSFARERDAVAIVGILNEDMPIKNLSSQYFNLRKHYDYLLIKDDLATLYTSITAIRKDIFLDAGGFNENYRGATTEDAELGRRLARAGNRIVLNKDMRVTHLKRHSLTSLLKSDFTRASHFMKFLLRERLSGNIVKEKRFGSFRIGSLGTLPVVPVLILSLILIFALDWHWPVYTLIFGLIIFMLANIGFFIFTSKVVGLFKNILMPALTLLDATAIFFGIIFGLFGYLRGRRI